jgi:hypothetical protein
MKIIHKISFRADQVAKQRLASLGVEVRYLDGNLAILEIDEADKRWPNVLQVAEEYDPLHSVYTRFAKNELAGAKLLVLQPTWHCGYPMPDDDFGYRELTYDLSDYCSKCGVGFAQKAPFRMKGEPGWGKKHILQLNWVFDEYFAKPETWDHVFKPFGIDKIPVLHHKRGQELRSVVQLKIDHIASSDLNTEGLPHERCDRCHRTKYHPHTRGMFPAFLGVVDESKAIFKTREYWGSGAAADKAIIINHSLYQAIAAANLKGVSFTPVAEV